MQNDALTDALASAIEKAVRLNEQAGSALEQAMNAAYRGGVFTMDYRYTHAKKLLGGADRQKLLAAKYFVARGKSVAQQAKAAKAWPVTAPNHTRE
jgi:hypothetical protein